MRIRKVVVCALAGAGLAAGAAIADEIGGPSFLLPREVVASATAFERYMQGAAQFDREFSNGEAVARAVKAAAAYEPAQLEEGMIAYGAIVALQDDRFVDGVERAAGRGAQRQALAERLIQDPFYATRLDGAADAAHRIAAALGAQASPVISAGAQVKSASYTIQRQAWSRSAVADAQGRLAEVKARSREQAQPSDDDDRAMLTRLVGSDTGTSADNSPGGVSALEAKALALAAEAVLGRAHAEDRARLSPLLSEAGSAQCLRMAKLNLYQCMAVAGPQYEDMYCIGQHALYDTGQCVDQAAHGGGAVSVATETPPAGYRDSGYGRQSYTGLSSHRSPRDDSN